MSPIGAASKKRAGGGGGRNRSIMERHPLDALSGPPPEYVTGGAAV